MNIRTFETGAKRDTADGKVDYDFISPEVLRALAVFGDFHSRMADGSTRAADDWQKGIPLDVYMKSGTRHFFNWWLAHRECQTPEGRVWAILGLLFNAQAYLHEFMKQHPSALALSLSAAIECRDVEPRWKDK
jgi:hypothetical protein